MDQAVELGFSGDQPIMFEALFALRERDYGRALEIFERAQAMGSRGVELDIAATRGLMDPQHRESALAALEAAEPIRTSRGYPPSMYYVLMDMPDRALDYLEAVTEEDRANPLPGMWSPFSASVREDPRFVRLAEAVGWVDYWREYGWPPFCSETNGKVECE